MLEVTAAIILKADSVFIAKKGAEGRFAGLWEFPGGKIDPGETAEDCVKRELLEEFLITIEIVKPFCEIIHTFPEGQLRIHALFCRWVAGDIHLTEHTEYTWAPLMQLDRYQFTPGDCLLAKKLMNASIKNCE
jgi:8-oxo-dGTP diphosphatase